MITCIQIGWAMRGSIPGLTSNTVTTDQAYTPYGELYDIFGSSVSQNRVFAGLTGDFAPSTTTPVMWDTANRELSMVGRWLSPDPAQGSWNADAYVTDPNRFIDPSGLDCIIFHGDSRSGCNADASQSLEVGDCKGNDPNNEFYFDGTVNPNLVQVLDNGDVAAQVNGGDVECSGDCPTVSDTVTGEPGTIFQLLTSTVPAYVPNDVPLSPAAEATLTLAYERSVHDLDTGLGGLIAGASQAASAPIIPKPMVLGSSRSGTSITSTLLRGVNIGQSLPTPGGQMPGTSSFAWTATSDLGAFVCFSLAPIRWHGLWSIQDE